MGTRSSLIVVLTSALAFGCKPPAKQSALGPGNTAQSLPNGAPPGIPLSDGCTAGNCPKAPVTLKLNGVDTSNINAQVGASAQYTFQAASTQFPGRQFAVFSIAPSPLVSSMSIQGNQTAAASMSWAPYATDPTSGNVTVRVRDMTACSRMNITNPQQCNDYSVQLASYDSEMSLPWSLPNGGQIANTGTGSGSTSGGTGGILGGILGGGGGGILGSLGGLLGGGGGLGGLGGLLGGGGGLGSLGGLGGLAGGLGGLSGNTGTGGNQTGGTTSYP